MILTFIKLIMVLKASLPMVKYNQSDCVAQAQFSCFSNLVEAFL